MSLLQPLVSILIPCYNAERWVGQAIESALAQTWPNKEVIVVDDGSTDGSRALIESFNGRIRYEFGPNRGGNAARNRLLELASGEWLQYLDADDYLLTDKITWQLDWLESDPMADIVYSPALFEQWMDEFTPLPLQSFPLTEPHDPWLHLARWRLPQTGGSLWRKSAIIKAGLWNVELTCCQEHNLYFELLKCGASFSHCPRSGAVYCYRIGNTVSRRDDQLVAQQRLELLDKILDWILQKGLATPCRVHAVNVTRFEIARSIWSNNPRLADQTLKRIKSSELKFTPEKPAASIIYIIIYKLLGFRFAERIATLFRYCRKYQIK